MATQEDSSKKKYFTSNFFIIRSSVGQTLFYLIYNRNIQKVRITKSAQHVSDPSLKQSLERINQRKFNVGQQPIEHIHKRKENNELFYFEVFVTEFNVPFRVSSKLK